MKCIETEQIFLNLVSAIQVPPVTDKKKTSGMRLLLKITTHNLANKQAKTDIFPMQPPSAMSTRSSLDPPAVDVHKVSPSMI